MHRLSSPSEFRSLLLLLTLLLWGVAPANAQTPEEDTSPRFLTFFRAGTVYPSGMFFRVNGDLPPDVDITLMTLLIEPAGASAQQFPIPLEDETIVDRRRDFLEVNFLWRFRSVEELPDLFGEVRYVWTINLSNGQSESVEGTVLFTDTRYEWFRNTSRELRTTIWHPENEINSDRLLRTLAGPYDLMQTNTQAIGQLNFIIYPQDAVAGCFEEDDDGAPISTNNTFEVTIPCDPALAQEIYNQSPDILLREQVQTVSTTAQIIDIYVQQFYGANWANADVPEWFQVGLSRLYDPLNNGRLYAAIELAARGNSLLSVEDMQTPPSPDSNTYNLWVAQSYGLILYTADQGGLDAVFELASTVNDYSSFDVAYAEIIGQPLESVYPTWQSWIFSDAALRTFALNLYAPATPTPTRVMSPTPTNTRLPTATPTLTPTITLTPTASATPTLTPTITPRPAQSLFTPTPTFTPVPEVFSSAQFDIQSLSREQFAFLFLIALALVIILAALLASLGRR